MIVLYAYCRALVMSILLCARREGVTNVFYILYWFSMLTQAHDQWGHIRPFPLCYSLTSAHLHVLRTLGTFDMDVDNARAVYSSRPLWDDDMDATWMLSLCEWICIGPTLAHCSNYERKFTGCPCRLPAHGVFPGRLLQTWGES